MSRKNKNRKPNTYGAANATHSSGASATWTASLPNQLSAVEDKAQSMATNVDLEILNEPTATASQDSSAQDLIDRARNALGLAETINRRLEGELKTTEARLEERETGLRTREERLAQDRAANERTKRELDDDKVALKRQLEDVKKQEEAILRREEAVIVRESDAEAGFLKLRRQWLQSLENELDVLRQEMSSQRAKMAEERADCERWCNEQRAGVDAVVHERVAERQQQIEMLRSSYATKLADQQNAEREMFTKMSRVEADRQMLEEDKREFQRLVERTAAARIEALGQEIKALNERLAVARQKRDQLDATLTQREEADRRFGGKTPEQVTAELDDLRKQRDTLRQELDARPAVLDQNRFAELVRLQEQGQAERTQLAQENAELRRRVELNQIAVTEMETLRDQKVSLESSRRLLQAALEELRKDVDDRIRRSDGRSPFPSCTLMDEDEDHQTAITLTEEISNLKQFAEGLRQRIAFDPATRKVLFYSARDVRSFLGGLAMSRLHVLQGISGTGKTSLPVAFARAVGAGVELIEVQAGWRDRQDLLGHFNSFERCFYESEFLQALYRAQCPQHRDRLFVVVLDEMNLSHPEQYFADLLSALEQDEERREIDLMTAPVEPAPRLLKEGRKLRVPSNVWFIGTANHDETTKDFADKTYDRAHVMELPRHREEFEVDQSRTRRPPQPLAYAALVAAFTAAQERYRSDAAAAHEFLEHSFGDLLTQRFGISWGNRLQRQISTYLPVVIAAGGTRGEALDHIMATKLLRKLRNRHDNRPEHLQELVSHLKAQFLTFDAQWMRSVEAGKAALVSAEMVRAELRRLGSDEDHATS